MTQSDCIDVQEEQGRSRRERDTQRIFKKTGRTASEVRASASRGDASSGFRGFVMGSGPDEYVADGADEVEDRYTRGKDDSRNGAMGKRASQTQYFMRR